MKLLDLYKQYGVRYIFLRIFRVIVAPIYKITKVIVYLIPDHKSRNIDDRVKIMDKDKIDFWLKEKFISESEARKFSFFLANNCIGYYIEEGRELAAWGFVLTNGEYKYGEYLYELPENAHMLRNLYVRPKFRGLSLGKLINEARIGGVPDGDIPCGFVIPENRYAIRNLMMYGFVKSHTIVHRKWFSRYVRTSIKVVREESAITTKLIEGIKTK